MKAFGAVVVFVVGIVFCACVDQKPGGSEPGANGQQPVIKEPDHPGKLLYMQFCLSCHMYKGEGVPGLYPPLRQTVAISGDDENLIRIVLSGQEGAIIVNGEPYNNIMTKLDFLTDQQVADVLSYVRSNFGNSYAPVSVEKVKEVRSRLPK